MVLDEADGGFDVGGGRDGIGVVELRGCGLHLRELIEEGAHGGAAGAGFGLVFDVVLDSGGG